MLISDLIEVGNRVFELRKRRGMTQAELAERADLSMRAFADFERGTVNMRLENLLKVCAALDVTPDALLTDDNPRIIQRRDALLERWSRCSPHEQDTALRLLEVYFQSLDGEPAQNVDNWSEKG